MSKINVTRYIIDAGEKLSGKRLIFLSDFHDAKEGKYNDLLVRLIKKNRPDAVLLGGDMINGKDKFEDTKYSVDLINRIASLFPVYYSYGNHERKVACNIFDNGDCYEEYIDALDDRVHFLVNRSAVPFDGLKLYGIDIPLKYYKRIVFPKLKASTIEKTIGKKDDSCFALLLGHTPDLIDGYSEWGADLVLAGHFHGGMVRLPIVGGVISPRLRPFPKYDYGLYEKNNTTMIVTNGIAQHSIKIRINNKPEIVRIDFK